MTVKELIMKLQGICDGDIDKYEVFGFDDRGTWGLIEKIDIFKDCKEILIS